MAKIKAQTLKGFRDFLPEDMAIRQKVIDTLREVFESYGYEPLETPALEYSETLLKKYGDIAEKLIYRFEDEGGRDIGLRYDLTVPLARIIADNPSLIMPFKRYQIQPVWRADKPQAGRFREFLQCDIDIVGSSSLSADAEIVTCLLSCLESLGFKDYQLLISDSKFLREQGIEEIPVIRAFDKLPRLVRKDKFPGKEVVKILISKGSRSPEDAEKKAQQIMTAPEPKSVVEIRRFAEKMGIDAKKIRFEPFLTRGLEYYTGSIFELVVKGYKNLSVGGGGRYDNLIGMFLGRDIPAVGFSFGLDRLVGAIKQEGLLKTLPKTTTKVLVTIFSAEYLEKSIELVTKLRKAGINAELYLDPEARLDKQLKYADKKNIPFVIILGPEEIKKKVITLRDMKAKSQKQLTLKQLLEKLG